MRKIYVCKCSAFEKSPPGHDWQMCFCRPGLAGELTGAPGPFIPTWVRAAAAAVLWPPVLPGAEPGAGEGESQKHWIYKGPCALEGTGSHLSSCRWGNGALRGRGWLFQTHLTTSGKTYLRIQIIPVPIPSHNLEQELNLFTYIYLLFIYFYSILMNLLFY